MTEARKGSRRAGLAIGAVVALFALSRLVLRAEEAVGPLIYAPPDAAPDLRAAPLDIRPFYQQRHAPPFPRDMAAAETPAMPPWLLATVDGGPRPDRVARAVLPTDADPAVTAFRAKNLVLFDRASGPSAPLLVWLSGTGGTPLDAGLFLVAAADSGYRVIGLEFDALPAGTGLCETSADPSCFARYREERVWGHPVLPALGPMPPDEAIVSRLSHVLAYLAAHDPDEQWSGYLDPDGQPAWSRIVLGGHSMGAGMAAYLAKQRRVSRVILSSSPWDHQSTTDALAPWLSVPSATPPDRWFGIYHRRETMAPVLARTYAALGLDADRIMVSDIMPERLVQAPATSMVFHGSWFGASIPLDAAWRPTRAVKRAWSFLLGQPVP